MNGFERYSKKTRRSVFLEEMEQVVPWGELRALIEPITQRQAMDASRWAWSGCCVFTFCSSGSTCRIRQWKKRCTIRW
jgi:IS5 family transposase